MAWSSDEVDWIRQMQGTYKLPGQCWATFRVKAGSTGARDADGWPEGIEYAWAILMPGEPPALRGDRMAGIDNADDAAVRKEIQANGSLAPHRAHQHHPDWTTTKLVAGQEWPLAGKGSQLASAPATAAELWMLCMMCLEDILDQLGIEPPTELELLQGKMTESDFVALQRARTALFELGRAAP